MKLKIISKQVYEDYEEENEEIYEDYNIKFLDKIIVINYNNGEVIYDKEKNTVEVKRTENNIFIELNKENESIYETPYGNIQIKTFGKKNCVTESPFKMTIEYNILLGNTSEYKNIIEILEANI